MSSNNTQPINKKNILFAAIGTMIEYYDFTVFVYLSTYITLQFFPKLSPTVGLISTLGVFAAGYIMRPLGGIFFGNMGDKIGRKKVLIVAMSLIAFSLLIMSILPSYHTIGISAVILMIIARCLQGFSVGGEYNGVLVMLLEQAPDDKRGFITSLGTFVSGSGVLLSSIVVLILTSLLSTEQMTAWGWRIPFILGFILSVLAIWMQCQLQESSHFEQSKKDNLIEKTPILTAIKEYPWQIFQVFALAGYLGIAYYLIAAFLPSYLEENLHYSASHAMLITVLGAVFYAFSAPIWGALSDKIGRKAILMSCSVIFILGSYPLFIIISSADIITLSIIIIVAMLVISAMTAVFVTTINELFPTHLRFSGVAAGYNVGNAVFGGTAPMLASMFIALFASNIAPAYYLIIASIIIFCIILKIPETRWQTLKD